jgi:hypothetical protein
MGGGAAGEAKLRLWTSHLRLVWKQAAFGRFQDQLGPEQQQADKKRATSPLASQCSYFVAALCDRGRRDRADRLRDEVLRGKLRRGRHQGHRRGYAGSNEPVLGSAVARPTAPAADVANRLSERVTKAARSSAARPLVQQPPVPARAPFVPTLPMPRPGTATGLL